MLRYLPDNIMSAKRFTPDEKALLIARSQQNQTGVYNPTIKLTQVKEALIDPQCWLLFLFVLLNETVNGGIANFGKLIVKGLSRWRCPPQYSVRHPARSLASILRL